MPKKSSTIRLIAVLLTLAIAPVLCAEGETKPPHPSGIEFPSLDFKPAKAERVELDNGLVLLMMPDSSVPLVRTLLLVNAGALCETAETQGLADLTARVMRLGGSEQTPADEMNRELEYVGASLESAAHRDYAVVSLKVLTKDLDLGYRLLGETLTAPAFPDDKIDQRKKEAIEKLRRQDDDPMEITRREFRKLLYSDHPYGRDPLGTPETLNSFGREDLVEWQEKWFRPNRTIVAVAGDFDRDDMLRRWTEMFGDRKPLEEEFALPAVVPQPSKGKRFFIEKDLNQSTVRMGHLGVRKDNPDALALDVLNYTLGGGGFSSRLVTQVRTESGFAYLVGSVFDEPLLTGQFLAVLQTQTKNTHEAAKLTESIVREIAEETNVTEEELALAKNSKLNDFVFKFETPYDVVREYAKIEFYGLPEDYLESYRNRLAGVTLGDLKRVAGKYLRPDEMVLLVLGNEEVRAGMEGEGGFEEIVLESSSE